MSVVRQLRDDLGYETLVIIPDELTQVLFYVDSASVAYLEAFDAHLRHGERKHLNLLESTVNDHTSIEARSVQW